MEKERERIFSILNNGGLSFDLKIFLFMVIQFYFYLAGKSKNNVITKLQKNAYPECKKDKKKYLIFCLKGFLKITTDSFHFILFKQF